MSCSKLKTLVAANSAAYPEDFVRLINSVSEDKTAQHLLEQNDQHGILAPDHNFVLQVVLATRSFIQLGLIRPEESWLAASKSLLALISVVNSIAILLTVAPTEKLNPHKLFDWLLREREFQDDMQRVAVFFAI